MNTIEQSKLELDKVKQQAHPDAAPGELFSLSISIPVMIASLGSYMALQERNYHQRVSDIVSTSKGAVSAAEHVAQGEEPYKNYRAAKVIVDAMMTATTSIRKFAEFREREMNNQPNQ